MKTIIEIGGFDGEDTEKYLKDDSFVYCFEPDTYHVEKLKLRFFNKKNIKIINKAVGTINGTSKSKKLKDSFLLHFLSFYILY